MSFEGQQIQVSWLPEVRATTVTVGPDVELQRVIEFPGVDGIYDIDLSANRFEILQVANVTRSFSLGGYDRLTFTDISGRVPAIIDVSVMETIAESGFQPSDVTFDADNIFVDMNNFFASFGEKITLDVSFNASPTAAADGYETAEDAELTVAAADGVLKNDGDPDGDPLGVTLGTGPSNGTLDLGDDGSFTYTPDADFNGQDSFTYTVSDGELSSDPATVTLTVTPVNDPPTAAADTAATALVTPVVIDVLDNDGDPDGTLDLSSVSVTDDPTNGTATVNPDGTVTYLPDFLFIGTDRFTYTVADDQGAPSNAATVTITVGAEVDVVSGSDGNDRQKGSGDANLILAFAGNDVVEALDGDDIVFGGGGNDRLFGDPGDDILIGGPGNDSLDGGAGLDTAVFTGLFADFRVTATGARVRVQDRVGGEGNDSLTAVELLQFDDGVFDVASRTFERGGFATDAVEVLVTAPGFSTDPVAPPVVQAQVETLVAAGEVVV